MNLVFRKKEREGVLLEPIGAKARAVAGILSDEYRLVLPYFQRGYAWQQQHVARLLTDLLDRAGKAVTPDWYPLGSIIVSKTADLPETWVADGHQRLITLTILIAILRDLETEPELKSRLADCVLAPGGHGEREGDLGYRLTTHEAARERLRSCVQDLGATNLVPPEEAEDLTESEANIIANRDHLRAGLIEISAVKRRDLARYLLDRCFILVVSVPDQNVARLLFSTMHDTGLKPSTVDLFKAQVLGRIHPDARDDCQTVWERLESTLGQSGLNDLLRHIAMIELRDVPKEQVHTVLQTRFDLDEASAAQFFVQRRLRGAGAHFVAIRDAANQPPGGASLISRHLQHLSWVRSHDTWALAALHWLERRGLDDPLTARFLQKLEALAWVNVVSAEDPARRDARYIRLLGEIEDGTALDGAGALEIAKAERRRVREVLASPNFTNRRYRLFLLLRINAALDGDMGKRSLAEATLEHIFPVRPPAKSRWHTDFKSKDASRYRNMLGNLTLLTEAEQNLAKNHDFAAKRGVFAESEFSLSRRLAEYQAWRPQDIERATSEMTDILMRSWGLM